MTAPKTADLISTDDQSIAYALKHATAAERRDIAGAIDARYPLDAAFGPHSCRTSSGSVPLWAANFSNVLQPLNISLDGTPYARAAVGPASHGYASLTVADGAHSLNILTSTGNVLASTKTAFACSSASVPSAHAVSTVQAKRAPASVPVAPRTSASASADVRHASTSTVKSAGVSGEHHDNRPRGTAGQTHRPAVVSGKAVSAPAPHDGPQVQTDAVSRPASLAGSLAVVAALTGGAILMFRRLRGFIA